MKDRYIPHAYVADKTCSICGQPADHALAIPNGQDIPVGLGLHHDADIVYFCDACRTERILRLAGQADDLDVDIFRAISQFRRPVSVSSQTWGLSASMFHATPTPVFGTPEWEAMEKVIAEAKAKKELAVTATQTTLTPMIAETIAKSEAAEANDGRDWKTRFDELIKKVTEF